MSADPQTGKSFAMTVLVVTDDLLFRTKIEATAQQLGTPLAVMKGSEFLSLRSSPCAWTSALVDLNLASADSLEVITQLRAISSERIIGYCSHVQLELQECARQAGCTTVLPRSVFVQHLPELLSNANRK